MQLIFRAHFFRNIFSIVLGFAKNINNKLFSANKLNRIKLPSIFLKEKKIFIIEISLRMVTETYIEKIVNQLQQHAITNF